MKIALTGRMGRGKSTVSAYLVETHGFVRLGFADKLKRVVQDLRPDLFENGNKPRQVLQRVGQALKDELGQTIWLDHVLKQVETGIPVYEDDVYCGQQKDYFVIDDVRFDFEAQALRNAGFVVVKIEGDNQRNKTDDTIYGNHMSETGVDTIKPDFVLRNNGTLDELYRDVDRLLIAIKAVKKQ